MINSKFLKNIIILLTAFIIGLLLIIQLKNIEKITGGLSTSQRSLQLQAELKSIKEEREALELELNKIEESIAKLQDENSATEIEEQLKSEIEKYDKIIGNTEVSGKGIEVTISDEKNGTLIINNYELILSIINKLNAAGAEAIAINNIRYGVNSYFYLDKGVLKIDNQALTLPIKIQAIGEQDVMEASLNMRYGILYELKNTYGVNSSLIKIDDMKLPRISKIQNDRE